MSLVSCFKRLKQAMKIGDLEDEKKTQKREKYETGSTSHRFIEEGIQFHMVQCLTQFLFKNFACIFLFPYKIVFLVYLYSNNCV